MPSSDDVIDIDTPTGLARAHVRRAGRRPGGLLVLGHGAGGGIEAVDLQAVAIASVEAGWDVVLLEQPWRVAGRRVAAAPPKLDQAFIAVIEQLRAQRRWAGVRVVFGGRSAGARVAARCAVPLAAAGVVALAFPLHPPGKPERSRADELAMPIEAGVPVLVIQGARDPFGSPDDVRAALAQGSSAAGQSAAVEIVAVAGDHGLKVEPPLLAAAVAQWLSRLAE